MNGIPIEIRNVSFAYPDGTRALMDLSFAVPRGGRVGLVGANGAGKSTLLMLLAGLLFPDLGEVVIGGLVLGKRTLAEARRRIGYVFQDSDDQLFMPTVAEDVAFGPRNLGLPGADVDARVRRALDQVEALPLAAKPPHALSAGEKRRVAIATALAMEPALLVLDEPTAGLDPRSRRHLIRLLQQVDRTRIIATHDLDLVLDLCPRTLVLHEGALRADGPTLPLFQDPELLAACHLEKPLVMQGCPVCGQSLYPPPWF